MFSAIAEISWIGVIVGTLGNFLLGGIYFSAIIAKPYLKALGRANESKQAPSILVILGPAVCGMFLVITSAVLVRLLNIKTIPDALIFGTIVGIGYLIPMTMTIAINPNFPRPFFYTAINAPYFLVSSILTCILLVVIG